VVVTCGGADARDFNSDGAPITLRYRVVDLGDPRGGKLGYLLKIRSARRAIRQAKADIVHAHWLTSYGLLALAAGRHPLVVTAHGDDVLIAPRNRMMRMIVRRVLRHADLITVPSEPMRVAAEALLEPHLPPAGGIAVFQYGVETRRLANIGADVRASVDARSGTRIRLVSARALLQLYRIDALIAAIALLRDEGYDVTCDILGDGPERASLESLSRALGVEDCVKFHGAVTPGDVERYVASADAYVSVSESDGVSLALLEALSLGAVPVLSNIPANRPWVNDGETGVLVPIDPAGIARGIRQAIALDRERVAADNLAIVAERADRDTNLGVCERLIDSLIGVEWDATPVGSDSDGERAA
jgi:glycosyltransferase involved in cell wall biosynthesis